MKKIILVCTGNTCRSPMAEGILKKYLLDNKITDISVSSMGLSAYDGDWASANAIDALDEIGIDIKSHRSKRVLAKDIYEADRIYVMTLQHKNVIVETFNSKEIEEKIVVLNVPDPFGQSIERYRVCRDQMIEFFEKEINFLKGKKYAAN